MVGNLISLNPTVGRDPEDYNLIVSCHQTGAHLDGSPRPALARSGQVRANALDCRLGVCKDSAVVAGALCLVERSECLVDGKHLSVENLLVGAQVEMAPLPGLGLLSFIYNPLHAARTAMAAACCYSFGQQQAFLYNLFLPRMSSCRHSGASPPATLLPL